MLVTAIVGVVGALLAGVFWALCKSRTIVGEAIAALLPVCVILYYSLPLFADATPGAIVRHNGWVQSTGDLVLLAVGLLVIAALGFVALSKTGVISALARVAARRKDDSGVG